MAQKLNYLGIPVYMNGKNYYMPSLSYQDFREHYEFLSSAQAVDGAKLLEYFEQLVPIIGKALRRNYPEIEDEHLRRWLDMTTLPLAAKALQSASGMTSVAEGE